MSDALLYNVLNSVIFHPNVFDICVIRLVLGK
jgi:hypothetical protein